MTTAPQVTYVKGKVSSFATFCGYEPRTITGHVMMKDGRSIVFPCERFASYHGSRLEFELRLRAGVRRLVVFEYPAKDQLKLGRIHARKNLTTKI
jgi:hypothetical protein